MMSIGNCRGLGRDAPVNQLERAGTTFHLRRREAVGGSGWEKVDLVGKFRTAVCSDQRPWDRRSQRT